VGSQDDPPGKEGLAALTSELVARGSSRALSHDQVSERFYPIAAGLTGDCRKEVTVFEGQVHHTALATYMPVVGSMLTIPRFDPDEFELLRAEAIARLHALPDPGDTELARRALEARIYGDGGHPYRHPEIGTVAGLRAITLDDVREFHRAHYTREALVLGIAGDVIPRDLDFVRMQLSLLGSVVSAPVELPPPRPVRGLELTVWARPGDSDQTTLAVGFPLVETPGTDDIAALAVAQFHLARRHRRPGGSVTTPDPDSGRPVLADEPGQGDMPSLLDPADPRRQRVFLLGFRTPAGAPAAAALQAALDDLVRLAHDGLGAAEFSEARAVLRHALHLRGTSLACRLADATPGLIPGQDDTCAADRRLEQLTVDRFQAAVRRHLGVSGVQVAVVTSQPDAFTKALRAQAAPATVGDPMAPLALRDARVRTVPLSELFAR
jgi:zinc protease